MQPKLKLTITEPCHENWQNMSPTEQGRHCSACAKEVIDFTGMTDTEVRYYFVNKKKENVCGRFYTDQLNREIERPGYEKRKMIWYWQYLMILFLLLFKGNAGKSQTAAAQHPTEHLTGNEFDNKFTGIKGKIKINNNSHVDVSGKITDTKGQPIPGVSVIIKGKKTGTVTDKDGIYHLTGVTPNEILVISYVGYVSKEIKAGNADSRDCVLKEQVMGEVIMMGYTITSDYNYTAPAIPTHVAEIQVRDSKTSTPVKATLTIKKDNDTEKSICTTNKSGIYKLRRIKETENYTITVSAQGYKDSVLQIKGCNFYNRKETKYVFLEQQEKINTDENPAVIRMGMVSASSPDPLYVINGVIEDKGILNDIDPAEIENFDILKSASAAALYGYRAAGGVIIITTKKRKVTESFKKVALEYNNKLSQSKPIEANSITATINNVKITPNPVTRGNAINLSLTTNTLQDYTIQIFTATGLLVQSKKVPAKTNNMLLQLKANVTWSAGIYHVRINDSRGNLVNTASFIVE